LSAQQTEKRLYELIKKEIKDFANLSKWYVSTNTLERKKYKVVARLYVELGCNDRFSRKKYENKKEYADEIILI